MNKILVLFASEGDREAYEPIVKALKKAKASFDFKMYSAHKTPDAIEKAIKSSYSVIIAGAGLAAALPGVVAAKTLKPVIGVPCKGAYEGLDALLSIAQMPPGIPVLSTGVGKGQVAAESALKMLKGFEAVTIIGDKDEKAVSKALELLRKFGVKHKFSSEPDENSVNIVFTRFDEPVEKKDELVIYCPIISPEDDKAEAALNLLKHSSHGLWVGLNNGINAAIAAIEILNVNNAFEGKLIGYRKQMAEKFKGLNRT